MLACGIRRLFKFLFTLRVKQEPGEESVCSRDHAWSRNFAWHLLWVSTTEVKNIVKLLAVSQTGQFQLFLSD